MDSSSSPTHDNRPISTAASFKPQSPLMAFRPIIKQSDRKAPLGEINTPACVRVRPNVNHFSSTIGFNGNCPSFYGKKYAEKFEDFIIGKTDAVDVIKFRNQIVTVNPKRFFQKQKSIGIKTIGKLLKMKKERLSKMRVSLQLDKPVLIKSEDVKPSELKEFIDYYHNVDLEINQINHQKQQQSVDKQEQMRKRRIEGLRINTQDQQNIGQRADQNKHQIEIINRTLNAQRIQNSAADNDINNSNSSDSSENSFQKQQTREKFNDILQIYHEKIKQKNLFAPNPESQSPVQQKQKQIMSSMTILRKKSSNTSTKSIKELKMEQSVQKKSLVCSSKQAFNFCADNYLNLQTFQGDSEKLTSSEIKVDYKRRPQTRQEQKLQKLLSDDKIQQENYKLSLTEKMNDIDQIRYQKIDKNQQITHCVNPILFDPNKKIKKTLENKTSSKTALQNNIAQQKKNFRINTQENCSHDYSLVSEHEANLAVYYEQSRSIQSKIMQKQENTSKQMHNLMKLEHIKDNIEKINRHKLFQ